LDVSANGPDSVRYEPPEFETSKGRSDSFSKQPQIAPTAATENSASFSDVLSKLEFPRLLRSLRWIKVPRKTGRYGQPETQVNKEGN
jgi:hypothetical protein